MRKKLLLLALDGLDLDTFRNYASTEGTLRKLQPTPLAGQHGLWAELLTEKPWQQTKLLGFGFDCQPLVEERLGHTFLDDLPLSRQIVCNCPILQPRAERIWFSDGSIPAVTPLAPVALAAEEPFSKYRAHQHPLRQDQIEQLSTNKLRCLQALFQRDWQICIARFNEYDLLRHAGAKLDERWLQGWFEQIRSLWFGHQEISVGVFSFFEHVPCIGRVNLNRLLESGGYCKPEQGLPGQLKRRQAIVATLEKTPPVRTYCVDRNSSLAFSPLAGVITCSTHDIVPGVCNYVHNVIQKELKRTPNMVTHDLDVLVRVDGVEFSDEAFGPVVDVDNKPRTTHVNNGWIWANNESVLPRGNDEIATYSIGRAFLRACIEG